MRLRIDSLWLAITAVVGSGLADRLATGSAAAFLVYLVGHGLAFLAQLLIARVLGADSYGIYAYVFAWMSVLAYFAMLGFNLALLRFVSAYFVTGYWGLLAGIIRYAEHRVIFASLVFAGLGLLLALGADAEMKPELRVTFFIGYPLVLLLALVAIRCATVRAFGGIVAALVPIRIVREGVVFTFVCCLWLLPEWRGGAPVVMMATVTGSALALLAANWARNQLRPPELQGVTAQYDIEAWRKAAAPLLIVAGMEALFDKTGVLVLGLAGQHEAAGIYALVFNMAMLVVLPRVAIDTMFAPSIARLHAEGRSSEVQALMTRASMLSLAVAACIAVAIAAISEPLLSWFGPGFSRGETALHILLIGQLFAAGAGSQLLVLAMTGHEAQAAWLLALSAIGHACLSVVLAGLFGLTGAAIAMTAAFIAWNVLMALNIWRKLGLWPGIFGLLRPLSTS